MVTYLRDRRKYIIRMNRRNVTDKMRRERAKSIKQAMISLGPTFIKLGQILSVRPDLLPHPYVDVLSTLQDDVPSSDFEDIEAIIESELNGEIDELYDSFERNAMSGASLGQVHKATVNNTDVAVKIRRPGVQKLVEADISALRSLKPIISRFVGQSRQFSMQTILDEFSNTVREEMDYTVERNNLKTIRSNFQGDRRVIVPRPFQSRSTDKVLTMEYIDGIKINDKETLKNHNINLEDLSHRLQEIYFDMIIEDGIFHADPHPGNISVKPNGTIVLYDFGMVGEITEEQQSKIIEFYVAVARDNIEDALDAMIDLDILSENVDRDILSEGLKITIKNARGQSVDQRRINQLIADAQDNLYEYPFRIPPNFALLLRVSTVASGICYDLNPEIDFIGEVTDILKREGYIRNSVEQYLSDKISGFVKWTKRELLNIDDSVSRKSKQKVTDRSYAANTNQKGLNFLYVIGIISSTLIGISSLFYNIYGTETSIYLLIIVSITLSLTSILYSYA